MPPNTSWPEGWEIQLANYRLELELEQSINRELTRELLRTAYSAMMSIDGLIGTCIVEYQRSTDESLQRMATIVLANRAHTHLLSGWNLIESGAYGAVAVLVRAMYEDWLSLVYFTEHPEDLPSWWDAGQWREQDRQLDFGRLKDRLVREGSLPETERAIYSALSSMAHPSATSAMSALRPPTSPTSSYPELKFVPRFLLQAAQHSSRLLLLVALRVVRFFEQQPEMQSVDSPFGGNTVYPELLAHIVNSLTLDERELSENPLAHYGIGRFRATRL